MDLRDKIVVVDTCALINNPELPLELKCEKLIIPFVVLQELDRLKPISHQARHSFSASARSYGARRAVSVLREITKQGTLSSGVDLSNTKLIIDNTITRGLDNTHNDNIIIGVALDWAQEYGADKVVFITSDFNACVKASALGIGVMEYNSNQDTELYTGLVTLPVSTEQIGDIYSHGFLYTDTELYPNQFVHLLDYCGGTALGVYSAREKSIQLIDSKRLVAWDIKPRNKEQTFAMQALLDTEIPLATISGAAGSGKTILALSVALEQTLGRHAKYKKIMLTRPAVQADPQEAEVGTVPGEKTDKMLPWMSNFTDNLEKLLGDKDTAMMYIQGISGRTPKIELESLTQMRGRNLEDVILIVDEAQSASKETIKTVVTRMGVNSKLVLLGDLSQIDHRFLDAENNGLCHAIFQGKYTPLAAHVHLTDSSQRSQLAAWGAVNL